MAAIFRPIANLVTTLILLILAVLILAGIGWAWFWPRSDYARRLDWIVHQPVPFSHEHHVAGLGIDCRFCHTSVEVSSNAGMPPTYTCMTCHSQIWTNAAVLAPIRQSLVNDEPIIWNRVTDLPDYVYFNHSIHIAKGVGCSNCHGRSFHRARFGGVSGFGRRAGFPARSSESHKADDGGLCDGGSILAPMPYGACISRFAISSLMGA